MRSPLLFAFFLALCPLYNHAQEMASIQQNWLKDAEKHSNTLHKPSFIPNLGQWDDPSLYHMESGPLKVYVEEDGFTFLLTDLDKLDELHLRQNEGEDVSNQLVDHHAFRMKLVDGHAKDHRGKGKQKHYHNYFLGNDPGKWRGGTPLYAGVGLEAVYPGIDVEIKTRKGSLKYDFVVAPGADPAVIRMNYEGLDKLKLKNGNLLMHTALGTLQESIPLAYQEINGQTLTVNCQYRLTGTEVTFAFPNGYNPDYPLVIDPVLVAATLSGTTSGSNYGHGATFDIEGNIFTHAISFSSTQYPVTTGAFQTTHGSGGNDVAISKLNADGSDLIWASYLGGNSGDYPHSIVTNPQGELFVYGSTNSTDFPVTDNAVQTTNGGSTDIFVTHFNLNGTALIGSTYLGGSGIDGRNNTSSFGHDGYRGEIVVDYQGNALIASATQSANFPITPGALQTELNGTADGVVVKLSPDMSTLVWSTFLGGNGNDNASSIRPRLNGTVVVAGMTQSADFPMPAGGYQEEKDGGYDAFIVEFATDGSALNKGTFAGTSAGDYAFFLDINNTEVTIYGISLGDWPVTAGAYDSGGRTFVTSFTPDLTEIQASARVAANSGSLVAFMVDLCGRAYMSMYNVSSGLELTDEAFFTQGSFYLAVLEENLTELGYATYGQGSHVDGGTSRFDPKGVVYQGVCSGMGSITGTPNAWAPTQSGGWDIGVFKIDFGLTGALAAAVTPNPIGCAPHEVNFGNFSTGNTFIWDFGDGSPTTEEEEPSHQYLESGTYQVMLIAIDSLSCNISDTTYLNIQINDPTDLFPAFEHEFFCASQELEVTDQSTPTGLALDYLWNMGDGTTYSGPNHTHAYSEPGVYPVTLTLIDTLCNIVDSTVVDVVIAPFIVAQAAGEVIDFCIDGSVQFSSLTNYATEFDWMYGDGGSADESDPIYIYDEPGTYEVTLIASNPEACNLGDTVSFNITVPETPDIQASFEVNQVGACADLSFAAFSTSTGPISTYTWILNGDTLEMDEPVLEMAENVGEHQLVLLIGEGVCNFVSDTLHIFELISNLGAEVMPTEAICYYEEAITLETNIEFEDATYFWYPGGQTTPDLVVDEPGNYSVLIEVNNCIDSVSTNVVIGQMLPTGYRFEACDGFPIEIAIEFPILNDLVWEDGFTEPERTVTEAGTYGYSFNDHLGCFQSDTIYFDALPVDPLIQIPNIFTPNNDGRNDVFQPDGGELQYYSMTVYNRWGRELFFTDQIYGSWDGEVPGSGSVVEDGTYFYVIRYQGECQKRIVEKAGDVQVQQGRRL